MSKNLIKPVWVRLDKETLEMVLEQAEAEDRKLSNMIRHIVKQYYKAKSM